MYYELYIDVFFLENFMIDSLLLLAVGHVLKCRQSYGRIIAGGIVGSLLTCLVIIIPLPAAAKLILFHVIVNSLMITTGLKITGAGQSIKAVVLLYLSAIVIGGAVQLFRPWLRYAGLLYAAFAAGYVLFLTLWRSAASSGRQEEDVYPVTLYAGGKEKELYALWDTGNVLSDPVTGDPVNILAPGLAEELIPTGEEAEKFRYIPFRSVGGESVMQVFRGEKMCIHLGEECWIKKPLLGISQTEISGERTYQMILNPGVLAR